MSRRPKARFGLLVFFCLCLLSCYTLVRNASAAPDPAAVKIQGPDTIGNYGAWVIPQQQVNGTSTTSAGAALTVTLAGTAGKTTYITGLCCSVDNPNASAGHIVVSVTGLASGGTISYAIGEVTTSPQITVVNFQHPIAASAVNTAIVVTTSADATRVPNVTLSAWGFQY